MIEFVMNVIFYKWAKKEKKSNILIFRLIFGAQNSAISYRAWGSTAEILLVLWLA